MSISKKNISKKIAFKSSMTDIEASELLSSFLAIIKLQSRSKQVKLSSFGTFCFKKTPKRNGRNPKTKESYIIKSRTKLGFKPSMNIKEIIN
jgi:nucleoid DNA-binding protein